MENPMAESYGKTSTYPGWLGHPSKKKESIGMMKFPIWGKIKVMFQSTNPYKYLLSLAPLKHGGAVRFSDLSVVVALSGGLVLVTLIMYIYIYIHIFLYSTYADANIHLNDH